LSLPTCRFCNAELGQVFADLGMSPLANAYPRPEDARRIEPFFPIRALVCESCFLVQLEESESPERIFADYPYFSSYSSTWLDHSRRFADSIVARLGLDDRSHVVEVASNDGYLLQYFDRRRIPVLGVEAAANVAAVAIQRGIPTLVRFFGVETANELRENWQADLLIGNNVLGHVPDLNDFVEGMRLLLKPDGVVAVEFPHLQHLVGDLQFDTIYHEHFSYFSFVTAQRVFEAHGLVVFDVEELPTHGGSLRVFARHLDDGSKPVSATVEALAERERKAGFEDLDLYRRFSQAVPVKKREILEFLIGLKREGRTIAGYGAPAKGNTLLNYCGVRTDLIDYTVDVSPYKQGCLLPGSRVPIRSPDALRETKPDVVLILPWNLREEIVEQHSYIRDWNGRFAVLSPSIALIE
jgi:SAM-dependent methyltransferase